MDNQLMFLAIMRLLQGYSRATSIEQQPQTHRWLWAVVQAIRTGLQTLKHLALQPRSHHPQRGV